MGTTSGPPPGGAEPGGPLRRNRAFRRLWASRAISYFGDSLGLVALLLHVTASTGQALAVAALLLAGDFAPSLLGPLAGAVGDRFDLRRVMVGCELVQAATVVVLAATLPPLPAILGLVAVRSVAGQVFAPAARAAVPALVPDHRLEPANAALGFGANGMEALGPLAAAVLLPLVGVRGVLAVDAATFLVSAVALARLPVLARGSTGPRPTLLADTRAGLRYIGSAPVVRAVVLGFVAVVACNGVDDVALVFLTRDTLAAGGSAVALLYGAVGVGLLAGYGLLHRGAARSSLVGLLLAGFAVSSLGNLLTGLAWAVAVAFAVQLVRGLGLAGIDVGVTTLLQRQVPPDLVGRVFGTLYGGIGAAAAASYLLGAVLLEVTDPRVTFVVGGSCGLLVSAGTAVALARARRATSPATPEPPGTQ